MCVDPPHNTSDPCHENYNLQQYVTVISLKKWKKMASVISLAELNPQFFTLLRAIIWIFNHKHTRLMLESTSLVEPCPV